MEKIQLHKIIKLLHPLRYVALFVILLMSFHYIYIWWAGKAHFYPVYNQVMALFDWASLLLFNQSVWVLQHIFALDLHTSGQTIWVHLSDGQQGFVEVSPGCTSLKQWMHWLFIMILFPGPWKHKLWNIPLGVVIIEGINIVRIVGLSLALTRFPNNFDFFHDYIFKTFFYFMIFLMWAFWVELFLEKKKKSISKIQRNTDDTDVADGR